MESLILLAAVVLIGIPLVAIIALVRVSSLRKLVDNQFDENLRTVSKLNHEIADLRNSLARLSSQLESQSIAAPASATDQEASVQAAAVVVPPMEVPMAQPAQAATHIRPQPVGPGGPEVPDASADAAQSFAPVTAKASAAEFRSIPSTLSAESESGPEPVAQPAAVFSADISASLPASDTVIASSSSQTEAPLPKTEQLPPAPHSVFESYEPLQAATPRKSFAERLRVCCLSKKYSA